MLKKVVIISGLFLMHVQHSIVSCQGMVKVRDVERILKFNRPVISYENKKMLLTVIELMCLVYLAGYCIKDKNLCYLNTSDSSNRINFCDEIYSWFPYVSYD